MTRKEYCKKLMDMIHAIERIGAEQVSDKTLILLCIATAYVMSVLYKIENDD